MNAEKAFMAAIAMQLVTIQKDQTTVPTKQDFTGVAIRAAKVTNYLADKISIFSKRR